MFIKKAHAGSAPGYTWTADGQVIEVEDVLAIQLLDIPHGGFSVAEEPDPEPETPEDFDEVFNQGEPVEVADSPEEEEPVITEPRRGGRPRLPRDENGNIIRN